MKNEKKIAFLTRKVTELEDLCEALKSENSLLEERLENNKNTILFKQEMLDEKETALNGLIKEYKDLIKDLRKAKNDYEKATKIANEIRKKSETEFKKLIKELQNDIKKKR